MGTPCCEKHPIDSLKFNVWLAGKPTEGAGVHWLAPGGEKDGGGTFAWQI